MDDLYVTDTEFSDVQTSYISKVEAIETDLQTYIDSVRDAINEKNI